MIILACLVSRDTSMQKLRVEMSSKIRITRIYIPLQRELCHTSETYPFAVCCATSGRNARSMGNSINAGPSIFSASSKHFCKSVAFSVRKPRQPYAFAIAIAFNPGKSNAGTFGVHLLTASEALAVKLQSPASSSGVIVAFCSYSCV